MTPPAVEMHQIDKIFPGLYRTIVANHHVDLVVQQGEFHVIVGENGAGKSTLMNVLYGLLQPDHGQILLYGQPTSISSPKVAIDLGIGMIHQHFMLVPSFTIGENIVLGHEPTRASLLDQKAINAQVRAISEDLKLDVDPNAYISDISVGVQQRVEIIKALYRGAKILILDEPTAVLTPQETDVLFAALKKLCKSGSTVIMITHKLPEVMAAADRVTVMRDGEVVGRFEHHEMSERILAEAMTGRNLSMDRLPRAPSPEHPRVVLEVSDVCCVDDRKLPAARGVSFTLYQGEILAIAGVAHNGQEELAEAIAGQRPVTSGKVVLNGQEITNLPVRKIRSLGMGHIADDRYGEGCARQSSVSKNMIMSAHNRPPLGNWLAINIGAVNRWVREQIELYDIKLDHPDVPIMSLSGGNVQKVIVAREMSLTTHCMIAEQPSRGIDIGATEEIYKRIRDLRDAGVGILLVSMDLAEVMRLADRILVIFNGQIAGERLPDQTSQRELGLLMAGVSSTDTGR
jgi:general nucleoside transport system ATP-binding protein